MNSIAVPLVYKANTAAAVIQTSSPHRATTQRAMRFTAVLVSLFFTAAAVSAAPVVVSPVSIFSSKIEKPPSVEKTIIFTPLFLVLVRVLDLYRMSSAYVTSYLALSLLQDRSNLHLLFSTHLQAGFHIADARSVPGTADSAADKVPIRFSMPAELLLPSYLALDTVGNSGYLLIENAPLCILASIQVWWMVIGPLQITTPCSLSSAHVQPNLSASNFPVSDSC